MSDWTLNDSMAEIIYEIDDRKIYNDIRSDIGLVVSETVVDADEEYSWHKFTKNLWVPAGETRSTQIVAKAEQSAIVWKLFAHEAHRSDPVNNIQVPYYDYDLRLSGSAGNQFATLIGKNTGSYNCYIRWTAGYRYRSQEQITHEEQTPQTLSVRAYDADSIAKYGRRVMNLTWSEGTEQPEMQSLVNSYLEKYKEPVGHFRATIIGNTDTKREQIYTREISDIITVVVSRMGANVDCYINGISIRDNVSGFPRCEWLLEIQRVYESYSLFTLDTSSLDGADILAP